MSVEQGTVSPVIGIDLGTTYCSVGVFENGNVTILADDQGNRRIHSCVAFTDTGCVIGEAAKNLATFDPANTICDALRLVGRKFEDPLVQDFMKNWPFEVISDDDGRPKISVNVKGERKSFFLEEICCMVLEKLKETAEKHLGRPVTNAVVTVPADFNYSQCQAIGDAATSAGKFLRLRFTTAPIAFANGRYLHVRSNISEIRGPQKVLVFDLGGGTLDVCIVTVTLTIKGGGVLVNSMAGNNHLGGEDFVNEMVTHFVEEFRRKYDGDITTSKFALLRLRNACETAKITLSSSFQAYINLSAMFDEINFHFHETITRSLFEALNANLFDKVLEPVEKCLCDAKMDKSEIEEVLLLGGSTRIPKIRRLLQEFFDGKVLKTIENSEVAVAYGAAIQAGLISYDRYENVRTNIDCAEVGEQSRKRKAVEQLDGRRLGSDNTKSIPKEPEPEPLNNVVQDAIAINKQILQEEIATDFAIVCGNGVEVKCHKVFLCAQGGVLQAKIESCRAQAVAATNKLKMSDMSQESVKAFLAFLYYRGTTEASKNSGITFELLRAAHKYDIQNLGIAMREMILTKEASWLGVDDAVRLFAFARHLENGEDLKMKAVEVLKENTSTLDNSECYKNLFKNDPESAMDLFKCSVSK